MSGSQSDWDKWDRERGTFAVREEGVRIRACACCGGEIAPRIPDPWEGRMDDYCEECSLRRCDASPGVCRPLNVPPRTYQKLRIPLSPHWDATLDVPRTMTISEWENLHAILATMKPGLVPLAPPESEGEGT